MQKFFEEKIGNNLKNLYIIDSDDSIVLDSLIIFLNNHELNKKEGIDVLIEEYDSFGIENSKNIAKLHSEHSLKREVFILKVKYFTHDAQNALLKLFEDTKQNKHFFVLCKNKDQFLDTILSRAFFIKTEKKDKDLSFTENFLKKNKSMRLKDIEEFIKKNKGEKDSASLRDQARLFIDDIESYLSKNHKLDKDCLFKFDELNKGRKYLSFSGSSVKMILEHISLVI